MARHNTHAFRQRRRKICVCLLVLYAQLSAGYCLFAVTVTALHTRTHTKCTSHFVYRKLCTQPMYASFRTLGHRRRRLLLSVMYCKDVVTDGMNLWRVDEFNVHFHLNNLIGSLDVWVCVCVCMWRCCHTHQMRVHVFFNISDRPTKANEFTFTHKTHLIIIFSPFYLRWR